MAKSLFVIRVQGDRSHCIIVSEGVRYESDPDVETVIAFFIIRRASGMFDIVNILKTFKAGRCVSRNVQGKKNIVAGRIADEIDALRICFALAIEKATGYTIKWHDLDLSGITGTQEQVAAIAAWGRVGVKAELDGGIGGIGMN